MRSSLRRLPIRDARTLCLRNQPCRDFISSSCFDGLAVNPRDIPAPADRSAGVHTNCQATGELVAPDLTGYC